MSCFLAIAAIASCDTGEDCCTGTTGSSRTSLLGDYDCGAETCGTGEVCVRYYGGIDAATSGGDELPSGSCATPPQFCTVENCGVYDDGCSDCLQSLCSNLDYVSVMGRDVSCHGA